MNTKYKYSEKYIPTEIVSNIFSHSQYSFVDKLLTGNGFTTAFLNMSVPKGKSNIIIVPNKQVVISKQQKHNEVLRYGSEKEKSNLKKIGFFYGDISSDKIKFGEFDVMMFVVDSFLNYQDRLIANKEYIDKILVDEVHSMIIQSTFRKRLVNFIDELKYSFNDKRIVSVTATPMLFNKVDIKLSKANIEERNINISSNQATTLNRIKTDLENKNNVLVALQDVRLLKQLADSNGVLKANFKIGKTLMLKMCEAVNLIIDKESNLTIISSSGFEGFDVDNGINKVYIFEDRAYDYQTFYPQNIIQIIGRSRKGTDYIEWCRIPFANRTQLPTIEEMEKVVRSKRISNEKKLGSKNYKFIKKYYDYTQHKDFGLITDFTLNDFKYGLEKELRDVDINGIDAMYKEYFTERGFSLVYLNEGFNRLNLKNVNHKTAFKNLKINSSIIKTNQLLRGLRVDLMPKDKLDYYVKSYEKFLRRKYYFLDELPFSNGFTFDQATPGQKKETLQNIERELKAYKYLTNEKGIDEAVKYLLKDAIAKKKNDLDRKSKEFKAWRIEFEKNLKDRYILLILAFSQQQIKVPKEITNSRDYNLTTQVSLDIVTAVADLFDRDMYEFDIVSCNIRIIYAMCGLELPADFYGENKKNKKAINKLLNKLSIDFPKEFKYDVQKYKENRMREMAEFGFSYRVINFLIKNFWNAPKDAVFNFCAYHEKEIINKIISDLSLYRIDEGIIRRHDSILYFGDIKEKHREILSDFEYKNQKKWFKVYAEVPDEISNEIDEMMSLENGQF